MIFPLVVPAMTVEASAAVSTGAWDGTVATSFAGGTGSASDPYLIENPAQLAYFASLIDSDKYASYVSASFRLIADIDLGNREWKPIGYSSSSSSDSSKRFKGVLDGGKYDEKGNLIGQYSITNFRIAEKQSICVGFFAMAADATIKNLVLQGKVTSGLLPTTTTHLPGCAMLVGAAYGTKIENVTVYANLNITSAAVKEHWIGGMIGYACGGASVTNCKLYGSVETKCSVGSLLVGGVAANVRSATFTNVYSDIDVYVRNVSSSTAHVGGLIGRMYSNYNESNYVKMYGCSVTGDISANGARGAIYIGGLAGTLGNTPQTVNYVLKYTTGGVADIQHCSFDGDIRATKETDAGVIYQGAITGLIRTYKANIANFYTSNTGTLYNEDPNYDYGEGYYTYTDNGGHVTGISVSSDYGVAVRLSSDSTGLRFNSLINKSLYDVISNRTDIDVSLGTLIAPTAYVEAAGAFTTERLDAFASSNGLPVGYMNLTFDPSVHEWLNPHFASTYNAEMLEENYYFSGAIANIVEQNYNRTFSGLGYVTLTSGGYSHTFYADYTDASRSRTVGYVATCATNDRSVTQNGVYRYEINDGNENGAYSPYTASQLANIKKYVDAYNADYMNTEMLTLVENRASDYAIVYPFSATEEEMALAAYLQYAIKALTGVELPMRENLATSLVKECEIVVDCTERASDYSIGGSNFGLAYSVSTSGKRILILGEDTSALSAAILSFVNQVFGIDLTQTTAITANTATTVRVDRFIHLTPADDDAITPLSDLSIANYRIIYNEDSYVQKRMAVSMQDRYLDVMGSELPLYEDSHWIVTTVDRIVFKDDKTLTNGDFKIETTKSASSGKTEICISAGSYYGYEGAEDFLFAAIRSGVAPVTMSGFTARGNYKTWVGDGFEAVTKYAYEKNGTARIMYYNTLWHDSQSSTYNTPTSERNVVQTEMIAQYMPDVLALQEFNLSRRGGSAYSTTGNGGMVELLGNLGYAETIDPRVKNAYATTSTIPGTNQKVPGSTDTWVTATTTAGANSSYVSGSYLKGYGVGGAYTVTYNSETYSTYFNCTPLFYNKNTTTYNAGGYYWYHAQWDRRTDSTHDNGSSDCASKAATWGLFTNKATNQQYIVIGTHMCTRSDYIRSLQALELEALISDLVKTYNVPVFLGGDLNGRDTDAAGGNYRHFANVAGYTDLQSTGVAGMFSSNLISTHSYPDNTNTKLGILQLNTFDDEGKAISKDTTYYYANSIDRILMANDNRVAVNIFGVVYDEYTRVGSDHMPVFCDMSILRFDDYTQKY